MRQPSLLPPGGEVQDVTNPVLVAVSALPETTVWRQNSGVFLTLDGKRYVKASATGVADIMGAHRGWPIAIETKTRRGTLERSQRRFREAWTRAGGVYIVARCVDDALAALAAL
jgi:hypothetical protein